MITAVSFVEKVLAWYDQHGRKHLPWQQDVTPYTVWVSEIMLQQTQVSTVINYFSRFMESLPTVQALANATQDEVLHLWTGLGYYSRARNLQKTAQIITNDYQGIFPDTVEELSELPGIGRSTAGAILSLAMNKRAAILDGNVKRVLCRYLAVEGYPGETKVAKQLWEIADQLTPNERVNHYTQAMMDMGAMLCTRTKPNCLLCPIQVDCKARIAGNTKDYPNPKPKKELPQKHVIMPLFKHQDAILLYQRPNTGLWGGLWSLPEVQNQAELQNYAKQHGLTIVAEKPLTKLVHTFSHFQLTIEPYLIEVSPNVNKVAENTQIWYNLTQPPRLGLAAPVKKLLAQVS